jgi:hypothetical protein
MHPLGAATLSMAYTKNNPGLEFTGPLGSGILQISSSEYWKSQGSGAGNLTLTWSAGSTLASILGTELGKIAIAGWQPATGTWKLIPALIDNPAIHTGAVSTLTEGSLTSVTPVSFADYTAFTFAKQQQCLITAPWITAIVQPSCSPPQDGSISLSGLPEGNWVLMITGNQGESMLYGNTPATTVSGLKEGIYQFSVMDANGCISPFTSPFAAILVEY